MKVTEYPEISMMEKTNVLLVDGPNGTKKITGDGLLYKMASKTNQCEDMYNSIIHKSIFRGKCIGTAMTAAQSETIRNGKFDDIWLGDYWEASNGTFWRIVDIDYYYFRGNTNKITSHHVVVMPDTSVAFGKLYGEYQDYQNLSAGFYNCDWRKHYSQNTKGSYIVGVIFDVYLTQPSIKMSNNVEGTGVVGVSVYTQQPVTLPTEAQILGTHRLSHQNLSSGYSSGKCSDGVDNQQFALFRLYPKFIPDPNSIDYWTRDIINYTQALAIDKVSGDSKPVTGTTENGFRLVVVAG